MQTTPRPCYVRLPRAFALVFVVIISVLKLAAEAPPDQSNEAVVKLSPFTVKDTAGKGYVSNDSVSGLKSNTLLIDVPQSIQVIPRDVIEDLGFTNSTIDTVKYASAGVLPFAYGDYTIMRGFVNGAALLIDGETELGNNPDTAAVDSIEVVKGPAQLLFGPRTSLAGFINKHMKQPLDHEANSIRAFVGEGRMRRGELDSTGPIGTFGSTRIAYRAVFADQKSDGFRRSDFDNRTTYDVSLKFDIGRDSTLIAQYDYLTGKQHGLGNYFQDPNNSYKTYTGPGFSQSYSAKWGYQGQDRDWYTLKFKHAFGDNWDMVLGATGLDYYDVTDEIRNNGDANFATGLLPQYYLDWHFHRQSESLNLDINGRYEILGMKFNTAAGVLPQRFVNNDHEIDFNFPSTSITNPTTYYSAKPDANALTAGLPGTGVEYKSTAVTDYFAAYLMESVEVWKNHVILVAGTSIGEISGTTTKQLTNTTSTLITKGKPHRLGAIYKPLGNDDFAFFINDSTAFTGGGGLNIHTGGVLPPEIGEVLEGGFKTALFNGRISSTVTYYKMTVTNIPVFDFTIHPGGNYPGGTQYNRGPEVDLAFRVTDGWSVVASYYGGNVHDQAGVRLPNTINTSNSLLTRYDFLTGPIKGFYIGYSMFHQGNRFNPNFAAFTVENAFAGYRWGHWTASVNVDNLSNLVYSAGGWASFYHDISPPRNIQGTVGFKF